MNQWCTITWVWDKPRFVVSVAKHLYDQFWEPSIADKCSFGVTSSRVSFIPNWCYDSIFSAERAGFECHPLKAPFGCASREAKNQKTPTFVSVFSAKRAGFEYHPSMGAKTSGKQKRLNKQASLGGEGGIRTRDTLQYTRFPSVRAKPDYATSPNCSCIHPSGQYYTISRLQIKVFWGRFLRRITNRAWRTLRSC